MTDFGKLAPEMAEFEEKEIFLKQLVIYQVNIFRDNPLQKIILANNWSQYF